MNEGWTHLHLLRPQALWLLLLLPPLAWWWWRRIRQGDVWRGVVDAHLLPHLLARGGRRGIGPALVAGIAGVLAILALAGPSWRKGEQALWEQRAPLMVALDLSTTINAADLPPSRLLQARSKLATLLRDRQGGQVGLIAYAGDAYTVAPLTDDAANVALFLDALSSDVMPEDGQRADRAITLAVRLLKQAGFDRGDILLMTDHADGEAIAAAAQASDEGFRVSALGLGSTAGAAYQRDDGSLGRARLDAGSLRSLASRGGGHYAPLSRDARDLAELQVLDPQSSEGAAGGQGQRTVWLDEGFWLLPPLMLLALFAFRRGAATWMLACCALLWTLPAHAAERNWWQRADQQAHQRIEEGVQAYRSGDYSRAEQAFAGQQTADALYNRGNALAKLGRYDEAIAAYDAALARQPDMADAKANRAAVQRARQQSQSQGGQDGNPNQDPRQGKGQGQSQAAQGNRSANPAPPPSNPPSSSSPAQPPRKPAPSPESPANAKSSPPREPASQSPADANAQQAADRAQRERISQAMARQRASQDPQDAKAAAPANETAEQRERRQALEAWLKRVPDDPGGLLKAKFQLEHERRAKEGQ